jgi:4-amino-4-deoxy-L-arabinose transferase-like glycosyltransferase
MNARLVFGISVLMNFVSSGVVARLYVWPRLLTMSREHAVALLVAPHLLLRFIGLIFLVPGVVSPSLPAAFAIPAACGDLVAGILAIISTVGLARRASWAIPLVWVFNVWGTADLLFAFYQGPRLEIEAGAFGAAFFIPTTVVPVLLVTHFLIFRLLVRPRG